MLLYFPYLLSTEIISVSCLARLFRGGILNIHWRIRMEKQIVVLVIPQIDFSRWHTVTQWSRQCIEHAVLSFSIWKLKSCNETERKGVSTEIKNSSKLCKCILKPEIYWLYHFGGKNLLVRAVYTECSVRATCIHISYYSTSDTCFSNICVIHKLLSVTFMLNCHMLEYHREKSICIQQILATLQFWALFNVET